MKHLQKYFFIPLTATFGGGLVGAWAGAKALGAAAAAIGSFFPGPGTTIGGVVGGITFGVLGREAGEYYFNLFK